MAERGWWHVASTQWAGALRHPAGAWGWGAAAAVVGVTVVPLLVVQAIVPAARSAAAAAATASLVLNTVAVASGIFMYLHHRLTRSDSTAWLAAGLIFLGGFGLTVTGLAAATTTERPTTAPLIVADVVVVLTLLAMVRIAERISLTVDPAATGLVLAFVGSAVAIVIARATADLALSRPATAALTIPLVVAGAVVAVEVERLTTLPAWARTRLAAAITALFLSRAWMVTAGDGQVLEHLASTVLSVAAATLILGTSLATLRLAINDDRTAITTLQDELARTAAHAEADRERLHEVKGTIAGIASASRLIHHAAPLPGPSREMLEEMLERESARLQRLMQGGATAGPRLVTVDDVLRPLVVARRAQGQDVTWSPSGLDVWAREDDLTEVVNILLDNTAQHAPEAPVAVFSREAGGHVEIVVLDSGPGVPPERRPMLFHRGVRGSTSTGEGLGLHVAQRLAGRSGGYVRLDPSWQQGAAFAVGVRSVSTLSEGRCDDAVRISAK